MSKPIIKTVTVQSGVSKGFLENALATDISILESIFDLIDNSIDAARDHLLTQNYERDKYGLPSDYSGYRISIRLGKKNISILDNCLGIEEATLTRKAFVTANLSNHRFGIGHYGLGLKRALIKFGASYAMFTDNGKIAFKMRFSENQIAGNVPIKAHGYKSTGRRKTLFVVSDIKPNIAYELESKTWLENAIISLSIRYAIYTGKGLKISISSEHHKMRQEINGTLPLVRVDSKFSPINRPLIIDDVNIYVDAGVHNEYYFPAEKEHHSLQRNRTLTDDFGLYFICNDRVIVSSSTAKEHGWKTKWHSEYNGFVCLVRFVSEDSSKMPWNTMKTALKTDSKFFVQVRDELQPIADFYRQTVKILYPSATKKITLGSSQTANTKYPDQVSLNPNKNNGPIRANENAGNIAAGSNQQLHVKHWDTLLPKEFPISKDDILNTFIVDAVNLTCSIAPCAAAMLFRSILEKSLRIFIQKTGHFNVVKDHFYATKEGQKKNHSDEYKEKQGLDLAMMLGWLKDEKIAFDVFGIENKPVLWLAAKKASSRVAKLNGVTHGNELISTSQIIEIRNEIYPLVKFLVLKNSSKT